METTELKIDGKEARDLYPTASTEWKSKFENTFGKDFFSVKPTDRIKTVENACEVLDLDPDDVWHEDDTVDEVAYKQLKVIVRALNFLSNGNKEWVPDYNNNSQRKWYPWFYLNEPGFRLCVVYFGYRVFGCRLPPCVYFRRAGTVRG